MYTFEAIGIPLNRRKEILDQWIPVFRETNHPSDVLKALQSDTSLSQHEKIYVSYKIGCERGMRKDESRLQAGSEKKKKYAGEYVYIEDI